MAPMFPRTKEAETLATLEHFGLHHPEADQPFQPTRTLSEARTAIAAMLTPEARLGPALAAAADLVSHAALLMGERVAPWPIRYELQTEYLMSALTPGLSIGTDDPHQLAVSAVYTLEPLLCDLKEVLPKPTFLALLLTLQQALTRYFEQDVDLHPEDVLRLADYINWLQQQAVDAHHPHRRSAVSAQAAVHALIRHLRATTPETDTTPLNQDDGLCGFDSDLWDNWYGDADEGESASTPASDVSVPARPGLTEMAPADVLAPSTTAVEAGPVPATKASSQFAPLPVSTSLTMEDYLRCSSAAEAAIARLAPRCDRLLADPLAHHGELVRVRAQLLERETELKSAEAHNARALARRAQREAVATAG